MEDGGIHQRGDCAADRLHRADRGAKAADDPADLDGGRDMSGTNPARSPDRDNLLRRDQTCDRFEQAWRRGARPQLEDYLPQGSEHDPRELFADLLTIELAYR